MCEWVISGGENICLSYQVDFVTLFHPDNRIRHLTHDIRQILDVGLEGIMHQEVDDMTTHSEAFSKEATYKISAYFDHQSASGERNDVSLQPFLPYKSILNSNS